MVGKEHTELKNKNDLEVFIFVCPNGCIVIQVNCIFLSKVDFQRLTSYLANFIFERGLLEINCKVNRVLKSIHHKSVMITIFYSQKLC